MDLSQPATPAFFEQAGADPSAAVELARQANVLAGRGGAESRDERVALLHSFEAEVPPPKPGMVPRTTTAEAHAALTEHEEQAHSGSLAHAFAPPKSATDYKLPTGPSDPTAEEFQNDLALKGALHDEGLPAFMVESIGKSLMDNLRVTARESPTDTQARLGANRARLEALWAKEGGLDANLARVDSLLESFANRSPSARQFVEQVAPFLSPLDLDLLLQFSKHRPSGRRGV